MAWTEPNRGSALKGKEQTRSVRSVARVQRRNKSGACRTLVSSGAQPRIFTRYPLPLPFPLLLFVLFLPLTSDPDSSNLAIVGTLNARNRPATRRKRISRGLYKQIAVPLLPYLCVQTSIQLVPPLVAVPKCRGSAFGTARF